MESDSLIKREHASITAKPGKSLWKSKEFLIFYAIIAVAVYYTLKECFIISSKSHQAYQKYSHLLSNGWLFNSKIVKDEISLNILKYFFLGFERPSI